MLISLLRQVPLIRKTLGKKPHLGAIRKLDVVSEDSEV